MLNDLNEKFKKDANLNSSPLKNQDRNEKLQSNEVEKIIQNSNLNCCIQELVGQYSILENYFMVENIYKAIQMETILNNSKTSSVVDDVFFIIKKCLK
jgi:hypothetical protein